MSGFLNDTLSHHSHW